MVSLRPKILMVADILDWAYEHIARFVMRQLGEKYDFYIDYLWLNERERPHSVRDRIYRARVQPRYLRRRRILPAPEAYDLICFLGWYMPWTGSFDAAGKGIVQGIYTGGFPPQSHTLRVESGIGVQEFVNKYLGTATSVLAGSKEIYDIYSPYVKDLYYATGAYDTELFTPRARVTGDGASLVVGWTGDPRRPFKGFYDYVVPAVERAASLRPRISLRTRFRGPLETLPEFYRDVDVMLIASVADAGPGCFLEAGLCGVPSISTRIGAPLEVIRDGENGMLVERSVDSMARALVYLYDHRHVVSNMGQNIRRDLAAQWGFEARSKLWDQVFEESLKRVARMA